MERERNGDLDVGKWVVAIRLRQPGHVDGGNPAETAGTLSCYPSADLRSAAALRALAGGSGTKVKSASLGASFRNLQTQPSSRRGGHWVEIFHRHGFGPVAEIDGSEFGEISGAG